LFDFLSRINNKDIVYKMKDLVIVCISLKYKNFIDKFELFHFSYFFI